jgi:hypothetical protein
MHLLPQVGLRVIVAYRSFVTPRPPTIFILLNEYLSHLIRLSLRAIVHPKWPQAQGLVTKDGPRRFLVAFRPKHSSSMTSVPPLTRPLTPHR